MATNDIEIFRGDDYSKPVNFSDGDGDAIDITNYLVFMTVKRKSTDLDADAILSTTNGIGKDTEHYQPTLGKTILNLSNTITALAPVGSFYYDIQFKNSNGKVKTLISGNLKIKSDITLRIS